MRPFRTTLFLACFAAAAQLPASGHAAQQCLVIGDSLTKEYEAEFPALFPSNPASWWSRNWIEILHQRRTDWFDTGRWSTYADPRLTGHEHNWAFPGATTTEIRSQLNSIFNFWWTSELKGQVQNAVERVVIFAGGNDIDSYYGNLYNGANAAFFTNPTRDNLQWIVDYVRAMKPGLPMVLVSVPHLGCSPKMQAGFPTDPVKTGRVTAALDALNSQLASFAQLRGIGFAPEVYEFTKSMIEHPLRIGGIEMFRQGDANARPRYVFAGDGFHPGTCAQAKIAQLIVAAFRAKYPGTAITPLSDFEIVSLVLGLDPNLPYQEWIAGQGIDGVQAALESDADGDGIKNLAEFAIEGLSAGTADAHLLPAPALDSGLDGQQLVWSYRLNPIAHEWGAIVQPQISVDLVNWQNPPAGQVTPGADGSILVRIPAQGSVFTRLRVSR